MSDRGTLTSALGYRTARGHPRSTSVPRPSDSRPSPKSMPKTCDDKATNLSTFDTRHDPGRVCEQYAGRTIDFLKIDVEGFEQEVLEGADWSRYRPRVVLVEATRPTTNIASYEHWEAILLAADYLFAFFDGLNRYYVPAEDRQLLPLLGVPVNVFDEYRNIPVSSAHSRTSPRVRGNSGGPCKNTTARDVIQAGLDGAECPHRNSASTGWFADRTTRNSSPVRVHPWSFESTRGQLKSTRGQLESTRGQLRESRVRPRSA